MALKLKKKETMAEALERAITDESDTITTQLRAQRRDMSEPIHEARKSIKKIRALLRLARPSMPGDTFECENSWYRDVGLLLSDVRDAQVMIETVELLRRGASVKLAEELKMLAGKFRAQHTLAMKAFTRAESRPKVLERIKRARQRIQKWTFDGEGWAIVHKGLRRTYVRGRDAMKTALETKTHEDFHQWRKRVKDLYYQEGFLKPLWPQALEKIGEMTHRLSDVLGEEHDMGVLEENLRRLEHKPSALLAKRIRQRRTRLRSEAKKLGAAVYKESRSQFAAHFHGLWKSFPHG